MKRNKNVKRVTISIPVMLFIEAKNKLEKEGKYPNFSSLVQDLLRRYVRNEI